MKTISGSRVVVTSVAVSLSDVSLNLLVGLVTGSSVMFAQALQGLSDLVTAAVVFVGLKQSGRVADAKHPLGYGRELFFWVLIAGIFMFLGTGLLSFGLGVQQFITRSPLNDIWLAFAMLSFGLLSNGYSFGLALRRLRAEEPNETIWQRLLSSSLIETKATLLVDFLGTVSAGLGLLAILAFAFTGNLTFDAAGAMAVGVAMMAGSFLLIRDVKALIVGRAVSKQTLQTISQAAVSVDGVLQVLDLRALYLGSSKLLVLIELHFADDLNTDQVEELSDTVKEVIKKHVPQAAKIQVEAETPDREVLN